MEKKRKQNSQVVFDRIATEMFDPERVLRAVDLRNRRLTPSRQNEYVPPATPTEEALEAIWRESLRVERIGGNDDFFMLGGHSLLATQVMSRIRDRFRIELELRELFEH